VNDFLVRVLGEWLGNFFPLLVDYPLFGLINIVFDFGSKSVRALTNNRCVVLNSVSMREQ
jgi:hypothetical protein